MCLDQDRNHELLYLANSNDILRLISDLSLRDFYPSLSLFEDAKQFDRNKALLLIQKEEQLERVIRAHSITQSYCYDSRVIDFISENIGQARD